MILAATNLGEATTEWAIFVVAVGVFLGNFAWGLLSALAKWCFAGAQKRELEEAIKGAMTQEGQRPSPPPIA